MAKTLKQSWKELMSEDRRLTRRINEKRAAVMALEKDLDHHINKRNDVRQTINVYEKIMSENPYPPELIFFKEKTE